MAPCLPTGPQQADPSPGAVAKGDKKGRKILKGVRLLGRTNQTPEIKIMQRQLLFRLVEEGEVERVKRLLRETGLGPGVTADPGGCTLLHAAAAQNQPRVALFLLQLISPNAINDEGHTPAHLAAMKGHTEVLATLLDDPHFDHHKRDPDHRTYKHWLCVPLFDAILKSDKSRILDLLSAGAEPDWRAGWAARALARELRVTTARQLALALHRDDIVRMLENCAREEANDAVTEAMVNTSTTSSDTSFEQLPMRPLRVRMAASTVQGCGLGVYNMTRAYRGYVCILSYSDFKDRPDLQLAGSQANTRNLASVFRKMGYTGHAHHSLTAEQTRQELARIRDMEALNHVGCAIFVISSHGASPQHFLTSDMKRLNTRWVLDLFKDSQCPRLKKKPKLFIWDLCRGFYRDEGGAADGGRDDRVDEPVRDVVCLSSSSGGFTWYTVSKDGTPFIRALCRTLEDHAHDKELEQFYREFLKEYSKTSPGTVPQLTTIDFTKKFYFNPRPEASQT